MDFPPFWELLEQLGINLPAPDRLKDLRQTRSAKAKPDAQPESPKKNPEKNPETRRRSRLDQQRDPRTGRLQPRPIHTPSPVSDLDDDLDDDLDAADSEELLDLLLAMGMATGLVEVRSLDSLGLGLKPIGEPIGAEFEPQGSQEDGRWIPFGETTTVGQYEIPGLVYVGEGLSTLRYYGIEPSLIRPRLKVSRRSPDYTKTPSTYNPSYTQMREPDRAAYLAWLADGRCDPNVHNSYVWLFFYGLERRVLHDLLKLEPTSEARQDELKQIIIEVQRLKKLYGNPVANWSFDNKTTAFLEICRVMLEPDGGPPPTDLAKASQFELQRGLGQFVIQKQPIPADWALVWYNRLANNALPTPAVRCPEEFKALFRLRYQQTYGAGITVKPGKTPLMLSYFPASPSFGRLINVPVGDLPDMSRFTAKINKIGELVYACRTALDPLSRLVGRNPKALGTPAAIALLPAELVETHGGKIFKTFQAWIKQQVKSDQATPITGKMLLKYWAGNNPEKLTNTEAHNLSKLLAQLGYGIEPDVRFGGSAPTAKSTLALFKLPPNHPESLSFAYLDATLLAQMALAVASGDDPPSLVEQQFLAAHINDLIPLSPPERARLAAHTQALLQQTLTLRNLKARIERVNPDELPALARFLIRVAAADGPVNPKEVKLLEKAYTLLELDTQALYSDIHDQTTAAIEPVTVRAAQPTKGHKIPAQPQRKTGLDMSLVQSKLAESAEISSLLSDIFSEDAPAQSVPRTQPAAKSAAKSTAKAAKSEAKPAAKSKAKPAAKPKDRTETKKSSGTKPQPISVPAIAGLDAAHSALLQSLAAQPEWPRAELEAMARQLDLMLDGALEVINELAFERVDEPVTEESGSQIEVNQTVLQELLNGTD
jgi:uncharacterized tellurite resistance protein B-like protein